MNGGIMMNRMKRVATVLLSCVIACGMMAMAACQSEEDREDENRREQAQVRLTFLTQLNNLNEQTMQDTVYAFNELYEGQIHVSLLNDVGDTALTQLGTEGEAPDIVSLDERVFKTAVDSMYLAPLDEYISGSDVVNLDDMWTSSVERFRYDSGNSITPGKTGGDATQYALPADNNPIVMYYNVDWFEQENINIISIAEDDLPQGYLSHGYFEYTDANKPAGAEWVKTGDVYRVFNNQIAMNWDELMQLGRIFTNIIADRDAGNKYGFMSEWWFSWGWSVGGDCIQLGFTDGVNSTQGSVDPEKYGFSLNDQNKNILVTEDGTSVNGRAYNAGDILSYQDRTYVYEHAADPEIAAMLSGDVLYDEIPSMREAFEAFLNISMENDTRIAPKPSEISGTDYNAMFGNQQIAMLAQSTVASYTIGDYAEGYFTWDVAPMPQYREFNADGTLKTVNGTAVTGKKATHSVLSCYAISAYSDHKDEAWTFIEYLLSDTVQNKIAELGSAMGIPAVKSIAGSDAYLNSTAYFSAANKAALLDAAEYAMPGDWSYLETDMWIKQWQGRLNEAGGVRDGRTSLDAFFAEVTSRTNNALSALNARKLGD